jgi:hypothetical protein
MATTQQVDILDFARDERPPVPIAPQSTVLQFSPRKLRGAARVAIFAALPAFAAVMAEQPALHVIALLYLVPVVLVCSRIKSLAELRKGAIVVSPWGITLGAQGLQLRWQDVKRILEVRSRSAKAIDIELMWPDAFEKHASRNVRFGAWCQKALRVPAITLSLWLVDANAETFLDAVRAHRPDLLHANNRDRD